MLRVPRSHRVRSRRGNALAVTAVGLIPIIGVLAIVLDGGLLMIERRHAQAVADAAAYAAAGSLYKNYSTDKGLDPTQLTCTLSMTATTASVTLTYSWTPEGFFQTPITLTSTSVMPITY